MGMGHGAWGIEIPVAPNSNVLLFYYSIVPIFNCSIVQLFPYSNVPGFYCSHGWIID